MAGFPHAVKTFIDAQFHFLLSHPGIWAVCQAAKGESAPEGSKLKLLSSVLS